MCTALRTIQSLVLPGDVLLTIRPSQPSPQSHTYSLSNIHTDILATTNSQGTVLSTHLTGPFGEKLNTYPNTPTNTTTGSFQYVGTHEKLTEGSFTLTPIHMGQRVYLPSLGRFTSIDPIQGGTPNSYVYPSDPVNGIDITGTAEQKLGSWGWWGNTLKEFAKGVYQQPIFGLKTLVVDPVKQMTNTNATSHERAGAAGLLLLNVTPAGKAGKAGKAGVQVIKYSDHALKQLAARNIQKAAVHIH